MLDFLWVNVVTHIMIPYVESKLTGNKFPYTQKIAPVLVCDLLGFQNYVKKHDLREIMTTIVDLLEDLFFLKEHNLGANSFRGDEILRERFSTFLPDEYHFDASLIADTIIIHPIDEALNSAVKYEIEVLLMSSASSKLFTRVLDKYQMLLRGALCYGEYCVLDSMHTPARVVFGEAVIHAYQLEKIQDWGGILISPDICDRLSRSHLLHSFFMEYPEIPIKELSQDIFEDIGYQKSEFRYVLDWPKWVDTIDWGPIYERLTEIENPRIREQAKEKIEKTEQFYHESKGTTT